MAETGPTTPGRATEPPTSATAALAGGMSEMERDVILALVALDACTRAERVLQNGLSHRGGSPEEAFALSAECEAAWAAFFERLETLEARQARCDFDRQLSRIATLLAGVFRLETLQEMGALAAFFHNRRADFVVTGTGRRGARGRKIHAASFTMLNRIAGLDDWQQPSVARPLQTSRQGPTSAC